jgi:GT2 family glycosyltransferase
MVRARIAWSTTNYGPIEATVYQNHLAAVANAARNFDLTYVGTTDKLYTHTASNLLVEGALEHCNDYVFFTENDMLLPFDVVKRLYDAIQKTNLDACAGLYFLRGDGTQPCLYNVNPDKTNKYGFIPVLLVPEGELFTIDCPGMGCVLFKTDTFRKIEPPWFDLKEGKYGQDIFFWRKAYDNGIKCGVDTSVQCGHLCERRVVTIQDYRDWLLKNKNDKAGGFVLTSPMNSMTHKPEIIGGKV